MEFSHPGPHGQCTALMALLRVSLFGEAARGDVKEKRRSHVKATMGAGKGEKHPGRGRPYRLQYQVRDAPLTKKTETTHGCPRSFKWSRTHFF